MGKGMALLLVAGTLLAAAPAGGATWIVAQDGSGDFTTLGAAVAAAAFEDSILVGPGVYTGAVVINKPLAIIATHGPAATLLDGENAVRMIEYVAGGGGSLVGFRMEQGIAGSGGALLAKYTDPLTISECHFANNNADYQGGAISIGNWSNVTIVDCEFRDNFAPVHCGAVVVGNYSTLHIQRCRFIENHAQDFSASVASHTSRMDVTDCLFLRNESNDVAGAIYMYASTGTVAGNTFHDNRSPGRATVVIHESDTVQVERNIFSAESAGYALQFHQGGGGHACNIFWDNAAGSISGDNLAPDDRILEPLFCDPEHDVFELYDISPAAPAHSACGELIGAFPVACTSTGVESSSISAIKALY